MAHPHNHNRHHHRRGQHEGHEERDAWDDITGAVQSAWNNANPFNQQKAQGPSTIFRTVFTTKTPPGWNGHADAWTTLSPKKTRPHRQSTATTTTTSSSTTKSSSSSSSTKATPTPKATRSKLPQSFVPKSSESLAPTLAVATGKQTQPPVNTPRPTTPPPAEPKSGNEPISPAAKAGIAIGVLGGVLLVFLAVFFAFSRRKKQMAKQRREDDEKINGPFADHHTADAPPPPPSKAPRLSLRPVTQFLPNIGSQADRGAPRGDAIAMVPSPTQQTNRGMAPSGWERPAANASANNANPFGSGAQRLNSSIPEGGPPTESSLGNATSVSSHGPPPAGGPYNRAAVAGAAAAAVGVAAAGLTRKTSLRKDNAPRPLDLTRPNPQLDTVPPSPAGTEYSFHSVAPGQTPAPSTGGAAIAAAGGPAHSTVHRVQLDFNPTLEDELGLKAGQLVRLLHEYDDGWALCIRLDRSQQGVVPRTCLSTRPVKPRPAQGAPRFGPPVNPNGGQGYPPTNRPMTPQGGPRGGPANRPMTPQGGPRGGPTNRPMTPQGGPNGGPPYPRSQSPAQAMMAPGGRPQSPAQRAMGPGQRAMSPGPRAMSPGPRAMSPGPRAMSPGPRSQSPGPRPQQQGRPQSPSGMNRRNSPPGQSPMNQEILPGPPTKPVGRKPVPGQAY